MNTYDLFNVIDILSDEITENKNAIKEIKENPVKFDPYDDGSAERKIEKYQKEIDKNTPYLELATRLNKFMIVDGLEDDDNLDVYADKENKRFYIYSLYRGSYVWFNSKEAEKLVDSLGIKRLGKLHGRKNDYNKLNEFEKATLDLMDGQANSFTSSQAELNYDILHDLFYDIQSTNPERYGTMPRLEKY